MKHITVKMKCLFHVIAGGTYVKHRAWGVDCVSTSLLTIVLGTLTVSVHPC
jgi:hypothetical protein